MAQPHFPNESSKYRKARLALLDEEIRLREQIAHVAEVRAALPPGGDIKEDYVFDEIDDDGAIRTVRLSELFEDRKDSLFLYGFMYGPESESPCPMCSSFLDALNGNAPHLLERINVAVVAKSPIHRITDYARARAWGSLRMLSSSGATWLGALRNVHSTRSNHSTSISGSTSSRSRPCSFALANIG